MNKVFISVDRDGLTGALQLSIDLERPDGTGHGYRLAGPKFNGSSKKVFRHQLGGRDVQEIRSYLRALTGNTADTQGAG